MLEDNDQDPHTLHTTPYATRDKQSVSEENIRHAASRLQCIKARFQDIFKGIGEHKYCQVQLLIDNKVKPIIKPQRNIPFIKRKQLNKISDELEES